MTDMIEDYRNEHSSTLERLSNSGIIRDDKWLQTELDFVEFNWLRLVMRELMAKNIMIGQIENIINNVGGNWNLIILILLKFTMKCQLKI